MGTKLRQIWVFLWWLAPVLLLGIFVWGLGTLPFFGVNSNDSDWLYGVGWGIIVASVILILCLGCYVISNQDEYYTFQDVSFVFVEGFYFNECFF